MWIATEEAESGALRRGTPEWREAWKRLIVETGDADGEALCPETGARWAYLASFRDRGRWVHEFCHRHHPVKRRRWYVHVLASGDWRPEWATVH